MRFAAPVAVDPSSWRQVVGMASVPEGGGRLVVLAGVSGQQNRDNHVPFPLVCLGRFHVEQAAPEDGGAGDVADVGTVLF
jgi:hypothetical protein